MKKNAKSFTLERWILHYLVWDEWSLADGVGEHEADSRASLVGHQHCMEEHDGDSLIIQFIQKTTKIYLLKSLKKKFWAQIQLMKILNVVMNHCNHGILLRYYNTIQNLHIYVEIFFSSPILIVFKGLNLTSVCKVST